MNNKGSIGILFGALMAVMIVNGVIETSRNGVLKNNMKTIWTKMKSPIERHHSEATTENGGDFKNGNSN